jgi:hypothetical protein
MVFGKKKVTAKTTTKKEVIKKDSFLEYLLKFKKREKVVIDEIIKKYKELK